MLDGRIAKISKYLNQEMLVESATQEGVAKLAAWKYNHTPNKEFGVRPVELFLGRDSVTQEPIRISVKDLVERRKKINEAARKSADKKAGNSRHKLPINFVPWTPGAKYDDERCMPLKVGDRIVLDQSFKKNEQPPVYVVTANADFPSGVDFDDKLINTKKFGRGFKKFYIWRFDAVSKVLEGKSDNKESENCLRDLNWSDGTNGIFYQNFDPQENVENWLNSGGDENLMTWSGEDDEFEII